MVERVGLYMANLRPKIVKLAKMVGGVAGAMNRIDEVRYQSVPYKEIA